MVNIKRPTDGTPPHPLAMTVKELWQEISRRLEVFRGSPNNERTHREAQHIIETYFAGLVAHRVELTDGPPVETLRVRVSAPRVVQRRPFPVPERHHLNVDIYEEGHPP